VVADASVIVAGKVEKAIDVAIGAEAIAAEPMVQPILIDNFDKGSTSGLSVDRINSIGGFQGTFSHRPSYTVIKKSTEHRIGDSGKGLEIEFDSKGGWCGWYTLLNGVDISEMNALTFWVKGEQGGERFDIGLADAEMQEDDLDAAYAGIIDSFLLRGA